MSTNRNKNNRSKDKNNDSKRYKSSNLLLEHITKEYDKEDGRSMKIETRIPIFITIATFFGGFIFSNSGDKLNNIFNLGKSLYSVYVVLYFSCIVTLIISIAIFIWILCTKKYLRIRTDNFLLEEINKEESCQVAYELIRGYQQALQHNIEVNDKKIKQYNGAIAFLCAATISYLIIQVVNFMIQ